MKKMTEKQLKLFGHLQKVMNRCMECSYHINGRATPFLGKNYKGYLILDEAPGYVEVKWGTPLVGAAGQKLWDSMKEITGLDRSHFALINSVNCRPGTKAIHKPTPSEIEICSKWLRKAIKILEPKIILSLGNYARRALFDINFKSHMSEESVSTGFVRAAPSYYSGIIRNNGSKVDMKPFGIPIPVVFCVHPAMAIYGQNTGGPEMLKAGLKAFGDYIDEIDSTSRILGDDLDDLFEI